MNEWWVGWPDLKSAIIGLITGVLGTFIGYGVIRYWSNRSIKSMKRRLEETEAQKAHLHNLAKSDRAVLLYGFQVLFALLFFLGVAILFSEVLFIAVFRGEMRSDLAGITIAVVWVAASIYSAIVIKRVHDYPGSVETFEKKITKLKNKLLGNR
jgi:hypothetical protein